MAKPEEGFDMKDWPRIAKIQSDLLAYALVTRQTRVAQLYAHQMPGPRALPMAGLHERRGTTITLTPMARRPAPTGYRPAHSTRICRWHVEEFAYLVAKLKSIPEGGGTVLDNTCLVFVHEHAEANIHKASGMIALVAGSKDRLVHGRHTRVEGTFGDLYRTLADGVLDAGLSAEAFPTSSRQLTELLA